MTNCIICGKPCSKWGKQFCSYDCSGFSKRLGKMIPCDLCGKKFYRKPSHVYKRNFCSRKCEGDSKKGKPTPIPKFARARGAKHHGWKGGRSLHGSGYWIVRNYTHPKRHNDYMFEHVLVAEKCLRRLLKENEVIHHINEIRTDNRPENLYLFDTTADHSAYHAACRRGEAGALVSNLPLITES